jgi:hypothetical protein
MADPPTLPAASPNPLNYFIGKGNVYMKLVSDPDESYKHVGNVPKFEITPKPETKKHYSSMTGTKALDYVANVSKEAEVTIDCDEITPDNLIVALLGDLNSDGSIDILGAPKIERAVKLEGTNDFGAKVQVILNHVFFDANKAINLIGDDWGSLPLTGQVLRDPALGFGKLEFL